MYVYLTSHSLKNQEELPPPLTACQLVGAIFTLIIMDSRNPQSKHKHIGTCTIAHEETLVLAHTNVQLCSHVYLHSAHAHIHIARRTKIAE